MSDILSDALPPSVHLERVALEVAECAAALIRRSVGSATGMQTKSSPTDVVTVTDLESERLIRSELTRRCPGSSLIGEEFADDIGSNDIGWIVDPIDGTVNFLYDLPVVSVSIAATIGGVVVAGAVVDIVRGDRFSASTGAGARLDGAGLTTSGRRDLADSLVGTGFSYSSAIRRREADIVRDLLPACRDIRCMGSAALNLCWVGCGRLDAFYERDIKTYDYAAGALIAREAGASVELPSDDNLDLVLASTPAIYEELRRHVV